jgi:D-methionine transport system substrate-binding protein
MLFLKKLINFISLSLICTLLFTACQNHPFNGFAKSKTLKVGTIAGPESEIMETARDVAKKQGLTIEIVEFSDYALPNSALDDGSIDANMFQHQPFLNETLKAKHYSLVAVGKTFIYPMGIYSKKYKNLTAIPSKALVAIPNDPSNETRALLLLEKAGLVKLKPGLEARAMVTDIINNPKQLQIKELDAAQLPRVLPDVDIGIINTNFAIPNGLLPSRDAIFVETTDSAYANIVVTRINLQKDKRIQQLLDALHSPEVRVKAEELFQGQAIPAW